MFVMTLLFASAAAATCLINHAAKMRGFAGWAPKGAGGITKLVPAANEFFVRRTYVERD